MRKVGGIGKDTGYEGEGKTGPLTGVFCIFLVAILTLLIVLPKEDFSEQERQNLQPFPTFSKDAVLDGSFEDKMEDYVSDHFPFRTFWIGLNSYANLAMGRTLINTVYVGSDGYYMLEPAQAQPRDFENNMKAIRDLQENLDVPTAVLAVPETGFIMESALPAVHLPYEDMSYISQARQMLGADVQWIDLVPDFEGLSTDRQLYYRTDHHWTTSGAYLGYRMYCGDLGLEPLGTDVFSIASYPGFLGTTYSKVLLFDPQPDTVELWHYPSDVRITTMDAETDWRPQTLESFYDLDKVDTYDPYTVFFGGNHGLMRITNQDPSASGRILVIKDSFANCFLPFLSHHYQETVVVDPRYYKTLSDLTSEETFDQVLFLYGLGNLVTDQDLGLINF